MLISFNCISMLDFVYLNIEISLVYLHASGLLAHLLILHAMQITPKVSLSMWCCREACMLITLGSYPSWSCK